LALTGATTKLSRLQRRILRLLKMRSAYDT
jgi:hypothetical protein